MDESEITCKFNVAWNVGRWHVSCFSECYEKQTGESTGEDAREEEAMKKIIVVVSLAAMLFMVTAPVMSDAWVRGGYYSGRGYHHHGGNGWAIAGAAVGGLVLGGIIASAMAPPVY